MNDFWTGEELCDKVGPILMKNNKHFSDMISLLDVTLPLLNLNCSWIFLILFLLIISLNITRFFFMFDLYDSNKLA